MVRTVLVIGLFLRAGLLATSQDIDFQGSPTIRLDLPQDIPSKRVQIFYLLSGDFGGYGSVLAPASDLYFNQIVAAVEGSRQREER